MGKLEAVDGSFASAAKPEVSFQALMDEVRQGSQDAAWTLLETYGPHVHRVVRRMLSAELRSKFDSVDFVQSVWLSFFANRSQVCDFAQPEQLVAYLAAMARNKVVTEVRRASTPQNAISAANNRWQHQARKIRPPANRHPVTLPLPVNAGTCSSLVSPIITEPFCK